MKIYEKKDESSVNAPLGINSTVYCTNMENWIEGIRFILYNTDQIGFKGIKNLSSALVASTF